MFPSRSPVGKAGRAFLVAGCLALAGLSGDVALGPAHAQEALHAALQRAEHARAEQRAELHATLRRHAEVLEAQSALVKTAAKLIGPSVVHIEADVPARMMRAYGRSRQVEEAGSGVIIQLDDKHYVLTNRHVVQNSTREGIKIYLSDGRQILPSKVWSDEETDVAVMAIAAQNLTEAKVGESGRMEIGDFVLAVGSPFGLSHSVTFGIISAKGRRDLRLGDAKVRFQDFLQTDAAINPGNSGGPLINLRGEIIGINTAIASNSGGNEGIGFAIPIDMFMFVAKQLIEHGVVHRAFLGVNLDAKFGAAMAAELGLPYPIGTRVTAVTKDSPAEAAGLKAGDVILKLNRITVEDDAHLINLVSVVKVGTRVSLVVLRDRKTFSVEVAVGNRSDFAKPQE